MLADNKNNNSKSDDENDNYDGINNRIAVRRKMDRRRATRFNDALGRRSGVERRLSESVSVSV